MTGGREPSEMVCGQAPCCCYAIPCHLHLGRVSPDWSVSTNPASSSRAFLKCDICPGSERHCGITDWGCKLYEEPAFSVGLLWSCTLRGLRPCNQALMRGTVQEAAAWMLPPAALGKMVCPRLPATLPWTAPGSWCQWCDKLLHLGACCWGCGEVSAGNPLLCSVTEGIRKKAALS